MAAKNRRLLQVKTGSPHFYLRGIVFDESGILSLDRAIIAAIDSSWSLIRFARYI